MLSHSFLWLSHVMGVSCLAKLCYTFLSNYSSASCALSCLHWKVDIMKRLPASSTPLPDHPVDGPLESPSPDDPIVVSPTASPSPDNPSPTAVIMNGCGQLKVGVAKEKFCRALCAQHYSTSS